MTSFTTPGAGAAPGSVPAGPLPASAFEGYRSDPAVDAQYNAGAAVPDSARYAPLWAERSRQTRARLDGTLDVAYGPSPAETLDIFPAARPGAPVFVFLHGGYWRAFTSKEWSWVAEGLVAAGCTAVVVNYALCPAVTVDEIVRQCRSAVAWTLRHIGEHGGDPARVGVGGHSAGGHLTAMCLTADWQAFGVEAVDPLRCAVPISGIHDLAPIARSYLQPQVRLDAGMIERNSPMFAVRRCATPALIAWGERESDEFRRQSTELHAAWLAAGNDGELLALPGADHFSAVDGFTSADSTVVRWIVEKMR